MPIWRMRIACWIPRATDTHPEYVILIVFQGNNGCTNVPYCYVYTYIACLLIALFSKGKVKVTLVQALRFCTGRTAHRGSRGIALFFHDHGTRRGWGVSVTPRPPFTPVKYRVHIVQEAGWAPGPVWTGTENLAPTGIRSPDRPDRIQSLYRLSYPAHFILKLLIEMFSKMVIFFAYKASHTLQNITILLNTFVCLWFLLFLIASKKCYFYLSIIYIYLVNILVFD
jgi:hypothetical protein